VTRLLADEDLKGPYISYLRQLSPIAEVLTAHEVGLRSTDDTDILEWAARNDRVVVSSDRQTMIGHAYERVRSRQPMPGVIIVPQDSAVQLVVSDLLMILEASEMDEWKDLVKYLPL
jgi:hypothetical protein